MSYNYKIEREKLFTEEGMRKIISTRDNVKIALERSGAVDMQHAQKFCAGRHMIRIGFRHGIPAAATHGP